MIAVKEQQETYFKDFAELQKRRWGKEPSWLQTIRKDAFDRFADLGFPTPRNEEWKYTNVAPLARTPFEVALAPTGGGWREGTPSGEDFASARIVFFEGRFIREISSLDGLDARVKVSSFAEALSAGDASLEAHLARHASFQDNPFVALNTAFMEDGVLIEFPRDHVLEKPVCMIFTSTAGLHRRQPSVTHPRVLVLAGRGSQVGVVEEYFGVGAALAEEFARHTHQPDRTAVYFTNAVTEVIAEENSRIDYSKIQREGDAAFHIASLQFQQARSSSVTVHTISLGGALDREDTRTVLDGPGAECLMHGLYVINGHEHVDNHTVIDHAQPHCSSRELYKGILDGESTAVFNGKIAVRKDAQKTDSKQSNKNLLLSEGSAINTKPQLEIFADDVKCTHGATIGQIDTEAIFYLRSRGITQAAAREMLTVAFANDVLEKIKSEPLRVELQRAVADKLGGKQKPEDRSQKSEEKQRRVSVLQEGE